VVWEGRSREASPYPDRLILQFIHTFYGGAHIGRAKFSFLQYAGIASPYSVGL